MKTEEAKKVLNQYLFFIENLQYHTIVAEPPTIKEMEAAVKAALAHMDKQHNVVDILQQLHGDLKEYQDIKFYSVGVRAGIALAIEQVERYIKELT